jgi:cell fate regulator YaaT (PSP1 superfamily)
LAVFGKPRYLGLVNIDDPVPKTGQWIVIKTIRGLEMGLLGGSLSQEQELKYRNACFDEPSDEHTRGPEPMLQEVEFVEPAGESQIQEHCQRHFDEEKMLIRSRQILQDHQLLIKLVDVEYTMDRKKLFFYFTSEQRVDFRAYVRDLAKEFRTRIEMRQIGVRDEAKTVRGIAPCGKPCCCSYWLHRFTPINIRMVKEQNLALNPTKISGICGRLMCCMSYEYSNYSELWKTLPNPGTKIKTPQGAYVLEGVDLHTESVRIRFPEGREVSVAISEFENFKDTVSRGEPWEVEPPKAALRRSPLSFRPSLVPRAAGLSKALRPVPARPKAEESPKDLAKNNRKLKPEKMTLEEHIAGRARERKQNPARGSAGAEFTKKRHPKHRNMPDEPIPAGAAIQATLAAKDARRTIGSKTVGFKAAELRTEPTPPRKDPQKDPQKDRPRSGGPRPYGGHPRGGNPRGEHPHGGGEDRGRGGEKRGGAESAQSSPKGDS